MTPKELREIRTQVLGLTQVQLARKMGMSDNQVARMEGEFTPITRRTDYQIMALVRLNEYEARERLLTIRELRVSHLEEASNRLDELQEQVTKMVIDRITDGDTSEVRKIQSSKP